MASWLKLIGSAKAPLTEAPFHGDYTAEDVGFRKAQKPGIRARDHLFLYAPGGSRRIFALAEAIRDPERDPNYDPNLEGSCQWKVPVHYLINLPVASGILIDDIISSQRDLTQSLRQASHIKLLPEESDTAQRKLEAARSPMNDWDDDELKAAWGAYQGMLAVEQDGSPYSKAEVKSGLREGALHRRSIDAIHRRMQNISHVLRELGRPWILGFTPASNVGTGVNERLLALIQGSESVPPGENALVRDLEDIDQQANVDFTTKRTLVDARLGQGKFRDKVLQSWGGCCAVTGSTVEAAIRASHIKAWRESSNAERLDPNNGLPLIASLDALFDAGLISFGSSGKLMASSKMSTTERDIFGIGEAVLRKKPTGKMAEYLAHHRAKHGFKL